MKYQNVCVEGFAYSAPKLVMTTDELEERLALLYSRLKLPRGRLELMTGILERRLWEIGSLPGDESVKTVERLLKASSIDRRKIGALIHASVCRDYQEPATACDVHRRLNLPQQSVVFDISNACLGILTGMIQVANMIELGQIEAGLVVGTENSRALMETTIARLNNDATIDRQLVKRIFASLTIGSGSAAVLLAHRCISQTDNRLIGSVVEANSTQSHLCRSEIDVSAGGKGEGQMMWTDSETLLHEGVQVAQKGFNRFLNELELERNQFTRFFCHQVGKAHQSLLFEKLGIDINKNFATLPFLGNTGSTALPIASAIGTTPKMINSGSRIALLGIGSGINVVMLAIDWNQSLPISWSNEEQHLNEKIKQYNEEG